MVVGIDCLCGRRLRAAEESVGRRIACPDCGKVYLLPDVAGTIAAAEQAHQEVCCVCGKGFYLAQQWRYVKLTPDKYCHEQCRETARQQHGTAAGALLPPPSAANDLWSELPADDLGFQGPLPPVSRPLLSERWLSVLIGVGIAVPLLVVLGIIVTSPSGNRETTKAQTAATDLRKSSAAPIDRPKIDAPQASPSGTAAAQPMPAAKMKNPPEDSISANATSKTAPEAPSREPATEPTLSLRKYALFDDLLVRSEPNAKAEGTLKLKAGDEAQTLEDEADGWLKIASGGKTGWVHRLTLADSREQVTRFQHFTPTPRALILVRELTNSGYVCQTVHGQMTLVNKQGNWTPQIAAGDCFAVLPTEASGPYKIFNIVVKSIRFDSPYYYKGNGQIVDASSEVSEPERPPTGAHVA